MAAPALATADVAAVLAGLLETVTGVRTYAYVSDLVKPPAVVVGQPDLVFTDPLSGYCFATYTFPLTIVTTRANDRSAQAEMSRLLFDVVTALSVDNVPGVLSIEPLDARPIPVTIGTSAELPGYLVNVRVRA